MPFAVVAFLYFLVSGYVAWRAAGAVASGKYARLAFIVFILLLSAALPIGFTAGENAFGHFFRIIGIAWILTFPYWAMAAVFFKVAEIVVKRTGIFNLYVKNHYTAIKRGALAGTVFVVAAMFVAGYFHFKNPVTARIEITIPKSAGTMRELRAVVASDWHLGEFIGREQAADYVRRINALKPDIILLPGDIVDRKLEPLIEQNIGGELRKLSAPLGVFAVLGNHEGFAGNAACVRFLEDAGIRVLRDEAVEIAGAFYVVGRKDGKARAPVSVACAGVDFAKPVILMSHRPDELAETEAAGADLQLSGHTHDGQIWPVNWVNRLIWEVSYGYAKKGNLQIYVTSGLGLWGLPVRIGTHSEAAVLQLRFAESGQSSSALRP